MRPPTSRHPRPRPPGTEAMFSMAPVAPLPWRRAMVTAGAGFLGSHLCERLLDAGVEVDCVDDLPLAAAHDIAHLADHPRFRHLERNLARPGVPGTLPGPYDLVLHLACLASAAGSRQRPLDALDTASLGTRNALAVAARDGARFLLASTCHAEGAPGRGGADDDSRRFAETLTTAFVSAEEADAGIVRVFPTYGPRMGPGDGLMIPELIRQALDGEPVTVPGDGSLAPSLAYVDDTVDGVLLVAASRSVRPVDIGGDGGTTVAEIARKVLALTGSDAPLRHTGADVPEPPRPLTGFAHELFGWTPRTDWDDGLKRTIADQVDRRAAARCEGGRRSVPEAVRGTRHACSW
ncbi:NAD-dependent epimerase/dehydratase family protein [Streptomyces alfalfae]|uniref:NAD-dependent epimerase/dehydratase family protein n=1 Tax=Streptomyces alfalfae TaxID=1642299 RepID=UPI0028125A52|nr:NAD-dependent epimerase/dehydratase family protein [Streptomyces alfalfae]